MKLRQYLGLLLFLLPFMCMIGAMIYAVGWQAVYVFLGIGAVVGCTIGGVTLMES